MKADCHIHMVLDGKNWRDAIASHQPAPLDAFIHSALRAYAQQGYAYLRDGGDRWGVGLRARQLAPQYGITYRTPGAPLCLLGHYGSFIGTPYEDLTQYRALVAGARAQTCDFIKIMISGLMDFNCFGRLTEPSLPPALIRELIHIAHEEGFSVMAHANGSEAVLSAADAGVDSVEHGAYLDPEALAAMAENHTVWVPTLSTVGNLRGTGRFDESAVNKILDSALENVQSFHRMGGLLAPGTDAGAWAVPHGTDTERALFRLAGVAEAALSAGTEKIIERF